MNFHDALNQIADIRLQVARAQTFRGYRPATTAFTGVMAIIAGLVQRLTMPEPSPIWIRGSHDAIRTDQYGMDPFRVDHYLYLWFATAVVCVLVVGFEMWYRVRKSESEMQRDLTFAAIDQFIPSLIASCLVTIVITQFAVSACWILPPLWMILFSMGIYSSRRVLPRYASLIAGYYLMAGLFVMSLYRDGGMHAWTMSTIFGAGQTIAAIWLWILERDLHEKEQ